MVGLGLIELLSEHTLAQTNSINLIADLTLEQISWRPSEQSSSIAWHLGHQAAVVHYTIRNLTAAEESFEVSFDRVFDSATSEPERGSLPSLVEIQAYRDAISNSTAAVSKRIADGAVGAPKQLTVVAERMLQSLIDHEYQHAKWIEEVRRRFVTTPAPVPASARLVLVDGYWMIRAL